MHPVRLLVMTEVRKTSFLKKRSKKLLDIVTRLSGGVRQGIKVFWFFFSKKNMLPS
jgi:hypothetical protein